MILITSFDFKEVELSQDTKRYTWTCSCACIKAAK